MRKDILESRELIEKLISENQPKTEIARQLNCKIDTLNLYLKKMEIVYNGNMGGKGIKTQPNQYVNAMEYIERGEQGQYVKSHKLRLKLIKDGIKEEKCEICGNHEWNGKTIPLELDHIDGDHYNNDLENLRIICPNCHAQTDSHAGKNVGKNMKQK
ncbi:putative HNH homing endonuclease [Erwinia phage pEa_SNUABM_12]|uniref:Putative HNH homing endonuclease n=1 Tax=Erwinia phage pEa_SNUABM_12 TaxID=2768773 RepID=A0A7L8ZM65_9CAUD|nr:putative HNH homing endonuclease [Erwinia phage pEa_SNUABM_12]QXO12639.1 hypothetical protein pEaSNUABM49_00397 [Erwinia phage pEa_SNUABM_49]